MTTAPYVSPEIPINSSANAFGGSATVVAGGQLWYAWVSDPVQGTMSLTTLGLNVNIDQGGAENPKSWTTRPISIDNIPFQGSTMSGPTSFSKCALVNTSDGPVLLWMQLPRSESTVLQSYVGGWPPVDRGDLEWGELCASLYAPTSSGAEWHTPVNLTWNDNATIIGTETGYNTEYPRPNQTGSHGYIRTVDVAACVYGQAANGHDDVLVATVERMEDQTMRILVGVYNTGTMFTDGHGQWHPTSFTTIATSDLNQSNLPYDFTALGNKINITWFASAPTTNSGTGPQTYLAVSVQAGIPPSDNAGSAFVTFYVPFERDDVSGLYTFGAPTNPNMAWSLPAFAPDVARDPAGRLCVFRSNPGSAIERQTYMTQRGPQPTGGTPQSYYAQGDQLAAPTDGSADLKLPAVHADYDAVTVVYYIAPAATPSTDNAVYEFILYGYSTHALIRRYGTARILPNASTQSMSANGKYTLLGLIDGPIPIPNENVVAAAHFGTVNYGLGRETKVAHDVSVEATIGFEAEAKFEKGVGPAMKASFESGFGTVAGSMSTTSVTTDIDCPAYSMATANGFALQPSAAAACIDVVLSATAYQFLDADGNMIVDPTSAGTNNQAPCYETVIPSYSFSSQQNYTPYAYTPGDLSSYTPEAINATMAGFGYSWVNPDLGDCNYFRDIIVANAYPLTPTTKCLNFAWGEGSTTSDAFAALNDTFTETSWSLSRDAWEGISGGFELSLFGLGGEFTFSFLVGSTFNYEASTKQGTGNDWGIKIVPPPGGEWGPESAPEDPKAIKDYAFSLYFLPPPSPTSSLATKFASYPANTAGYWMQELLAHLPQSVTSGLDAPSVDTGSGPWRIFFVVTSYESNDSTVSYNYTGPL